MDVEATAVKNPKGVGSLKVTGVVDEEEIKGQGRSLYRKSMAMSSAENVLTVLHNLYGFATEEYDIHINFPGGVPIDGPSAGVSMAVALYSALTKKPIDNFLAMTGEISISGRIKPVGGVSDKINAAVQMGLKRVLIPIDNYQNNFAHLPIEVIAISHVEEAFELAFVEGEEEEQSLALDIQEQAVSAPKQAVVL